MTNIGSAEQWTAQLAAYLSASLAGGMDPAARSAALADLTASHSTGQTDTDQTRQRILHLLAERDGTTAALLPAQPQSSHPLTAIPAKGRDGISLVAIDTGPTRLTTAAVKNWLTSTADEILLVDAATTPPLAHRLRDARLTDPRLVVIRLDHAGLSWPQIFNIGLRLARYNRLWVIADTIRFAAPASQPAPLPQGSFAFEPSQPNRFALDLHRTDLSAVSGFNEYLRSADGAVEDLASRLTARGLQQDKLTPGLLAQGPKPALPDTAKTHATLRDSLRQDPGFAALQDRHIAAALPAWSATAHLPVSFGDLDDQGQHIQPELGPAAPAIPPQAEAQALTDLLRLRFGGTPERLTPRALDIVLDRPPLDVFATDIAVAGSSLPDLVTTRAGWLVLAVNANALPLPGTPAAECLNTLIQMAASHQQVPVLLAATPQDAATLTSVTPCPVVTAPLDTSAFWPTDLRELARPLDGRPPRHATLPFNRQTLADLQHLSLASPSVLLRRPKIFIDAQHGLGNRMRAIASAGAIAQGMDRELIIIWRPDNHCDCAYEDLFFPNGAVLTQGFAPEAQAMGMTLYNYMEIEPGAVKDAPIEMGAFEDIYIRSAFPLVSRCSNWHTENQWIRNMQPNEVVRALVSSVRTPNDLSIHIRMEGGSEAEHLPYESATNWTAEAHQEIDHWRKRSHYRFFLPRLDALIAQGLADRVFIAADTPAAYVELEARYGKRVTWLPRPASDRSAAAIVYALADAILLGRAPRLLGSTWSSFSELAARLSPAPMIVELTGRDF